MELHLDMSGGLGSSFTSQRREPTSETDATIFFVDGTQIEAALHSRFEVFGEGGRRLRTVPLTELQAGDQVVILEEDSRALFSEKLMIAIDRGPLCDEAQKRETWLSVVQAMVSQTRPRAAQLAEKMSALGHDVDLSRMRPWLRGDEVNEASVPDTLDVFLAFAHALGITLPHETLVDLFMGIERWRVNHRKVGRALARAIRSAYVGKLDGQSLAKIEREWGLSARNLVEGARVAVIDDILLPHGVANNAE